MSLCTDARVPNGGEGAGCPQVPPPAAAKMAARK